MKLFRKKDNHLETEAKLAAVSDSLAEICKKAEPAFIALGNELQSVYAEANGLTQHTVETIRQITGESEQENILSKIALLAENSIDELKNRQGNVSSDISNINAIVVNLSGLYVICSMVEKIAMFLRIVGLNIDIESSRSPGITEMFAFVTHEIRMLSEKILSVVANIRRDADTATSNQKSVCEELGKDMKELSRLSDDARNTVHDALSHIETFTKLSVDALRQTGEYYAMVSECVADVVVSIQFHDSMSQRIEHIVKAVSDVKNLVAEASEYKNRNMKTKYLGAAHAIADIQINQLMLILSESDEVHQKCLSAFGRISEGADRLPESILMLGGRNDSEKKKVPLAYLTSALLSLHKLLGEGRNLLDRIQITTVHATEATDRLSEYLKEVRDFSFRTQLIALNAIIKSSHIGIEGATLEVLAQEMKILSGEANTFASDVENILDNVTFLVQKLRDQSGKDVREVGETRMFLDKGITDISSSYKQFAADGAEISECAGKLRKAIETVSSNLNFLSELSERMHYQLKQLEDITHDLSPWAVEDISRLSEEFEKLGRRYTMKKERDIHEQTLKSDNLLKSQEKEIPEDDFGENTEFF